MWCIRSVKLGKIFSQPLNLHTFIRNTAILWMCTGEERPGEGREGGRDWKTGLTVVFSGRARVGLLKHCGCLNPRWWLKKIRLPYMCVYIYIYRTRIIRVYAIEPCFAFRRFSYAPPLFARSLHRGSQNTRFGQSTSTACYGQLLAAILTYFRRSTPFARFKILLSLQWRDYSELSLACTTHNTRNTHTHITAYQRNGGKFGFGLHYPSSGAESSACASTFAMAIFT